MAAKKKSAATLLKELRVEHVALQQQVIKLERDVASKDSAYTHTRKEMEKAQNEIEQVHAFLDSVPGSIERKVSGEYGVTSDRAMMTRLAAWLAMRG